MANGLILRGEVYWVCVDDSVGSEQQTGRPAVIISGNRANEKRNTVIVVYLTNGGFGNYSSVSVNYNGKPERVLCDQIRTIDKQRLTRYVGKLSEDELRRVSGGLAICMCLRTDGVEYEDIFEKDENEELVSLKAEAEMWKRLYERTMDQLVDFKVDADLKMRLAQRAPVVEVVEVPVVVEEPPVVEEPELVEPEVVEPEPEPEKVDLNNCTVEDLMGCGCTQAVARIIIAGRPYVLVEDLRKLPGITNVGFGILKHKVCVNPMVAVEEVVEEVAESVPETTVVVDEPEEPEVREEAEKVNINTATGSELMEKLGIRGNYAYSITGYRTKNGRFVELEELKEVPGLSKGFYEQYKDRLTLGEVEETPEVAEPVQEEPVVQDKVNVNTASAQEIHDKTGLSLTACFAITGKRKRDGLFESLDELVIPGRLSEANLEKYRDKLTVGESVVVENDKVNINTATIRELMDLGFGKPESGRIVAHVKKYGPFKSLDELATVDGLKSKTLRKLRDKLEV